MAALQLVALPDLPRAPASIVCDTTFLSGGSAMNTLGSLHGAPASAHVSQKQFMEGMQKVESIYRTGDRRAALTAFLETRAGQAFRGVLDWLTTTAQTRTRSRRNTPAKKQRLRRSSSSMSSALVR